MESVASLSKHYTSFIRVDLNALVTTIKKMKEINMCGRFTLTADSDAIEQHFDIKGLRAHKPRYNIAPSQGILTVYQNNANHPGYAYMKWGFMPNWVGSKFAKTSWINARSETAAEKPVFRQAFAKKRCLIPADGYYEWKPMEGNRKQPFYCYLKGHKLIALAGIWEDSSDEAGLSMESCAILTGTANDKLHAIHDRMPVIIPPEYYHDWLKPQQDKDTLKALLDTRHRIKDWEAYPVSIQVNKPSNDTLNCIESIHLSDS